MSSHVPGPTRTTVRTFLQAKAEGRPLVMVTAYDFNAARLADEAGVDSILVGDSLGMVMLGYDSTLPVTVDDMVRHTAAVARGASHALVVADMPFLTLHGTVEDAVRIAGRLMVEGGAGAVKVEGGSPTVIAAVEAMVDAGIPVMGHVGLTPQSVHALGGFRTQGTSPESASRILDECAALEAAGAFSVVLECVPDAVAAEATRRSAVPTIGIGAGVGCDGQVQVFHDLLGLGTFTPRHAKQYVAVGDIVRDALAAYAGDVRSGAFPGPEQTVAAPDGLIEALRDLV